jgi:hypothetical protein
MPVKAQADSPPILDGIPPGIGHFLPVSAHVRMLYYSYEYNTRQNGGEMRLRFIQASKVKSFMKERGLRTGHSFLEAMDREVCELLGKYERVAKADRMKTVMAVHIGLPKEIAKLSDGLRRRTL